MMIQCTGCGRTRPVRSGFNFGEMERSSGFTVLLRIDTTSTWLCPTCLGEVVPHVRALVDLLKDPDVFWGGLPNLLKVAKT